jgi:hypothetical protein
MPRRKPADSAPQPSPEHAGPLLTIHPTDVYTLAGARAALRLAKSTFRREVREGRLRVSCRAGRRWLLGEWLLEWLLAGELPRRGQAPPADREGLR